MSTCPVNLGPPPASNPSSRRSFALSPRKTSRRLPAEAPSRATGAPMPEPSCVDPSRPCPGVALVPSAGRPFSLRRRRHLLAILELSPPPVLLALSSSFACCPRIVSSARPRRHLLVVLALHPLLILLGTRASGRMSTWREGRGQRRMSSGGDMSFTGHEREEMGRKKGKEEEDEGKMVQNFS